MTRDRPFSGPGRSSADARLRVLLCTDTFGRGGTERQLIRLAASLPRRRFDLSVLCLDPGGPFRPTIEALRIPVLHVPVPPFSSPRILAVLVQTVRLLRQHRFDVVQTFEFYTNILVVPAARIARVPVVLAGRRNVAHALSPVERAVLELCCRLADRVIVNSQAAANTLSRWPLLKRPRTTLIHNIVEVDEQDSIACRSAVRHALGLRDDAPLIGVVGGLREEKGHHIILEALLRLVHLTPPFHLVIVGDGPRRRALESLTEQLGLRNVVHFVGDQADVGRWLSSFDLAVSASTAESMPNAVAEAMWLGIPVVATNVGGTPELVQDGVTGRLVPAGDPEAIAAAVVDLVGDSALRRSLGEAGRSHVRRFYSAASAVATLQQVYEEELAPTR